MHSKIFIIISLVSLFSSLVATHTVQENFAYLEKYNHVVVGSDTPVYVFKTQFPINKNNQQWTYVRYKPEMAAVNTKTYYQSPLLTDHDTVYPEILVVVDYETYRTYGKDWRAIRDFISSLFYGYDLIFRQMSDPKVRLNIAGIIIAGDDNVLPFANKDARILEDYLRKMMKYISENQPFHELHYDIIDVILYRKDRSDVRENEQFGAALIGSACDKNAIIITRTTVGFTESALAVHEIAHALNAPHDEPHCGEGMNMGTNQGIKARFFSNCSIEAMRKYLKSPEASCLRNIPSVGIPLPQVLPGKMLSRSGQCRRGLGNDWVESQRTNYECELLTCSNPLTKENIHFSTPPAEGSKCVVSTCSDRSSRSYECNIPGICLYGICELDPEENNH